MVDPELRAAQRRLAHLLADEDYGPALVRLSRAGQREVLDLVEANQGRQARAAIRRLTEQRLEQARERRAARQAGVPAGPRRSRWEEAAARLGRLARKRRPDRRFDPSKYVESAEHRADDEDWRHYQALKASEASMVMEGRHAAKYGSEWSPFWYHYWR